MYENFLTWTGAVVWGLVAIALMFVVFVVVWLWIMNLIGVCALYFATDGRCLSGQFRKKRFPAISYFAFALLHPWQVVKLTGEVLPGEGWSLDLRGFFPKIHVCQHGKCDHGADGDR